VVVIKPLRAMLVHPVNLVVVMVVLAGLEMLAMEEMVEFLAVGEAVAQPLITALAQAVLELEAK
jgi:hypothetical protein